MRGNFIKMNIEHPTSNIQLAKGEQALVRLWRIERRIRKGEKADF